MTDSDFKAFMRIMKSYFQRVCKDKNCLFARIYGIYTVKMEDKNPVQLVVMGNTMTNCGSIEGIFDLKGSLVNRYNKIDPQNYNKKSTLKDKNLLYFNSKQMWLNFRQDDRRQIISMMK